MKKYLILLLLAFVSLHGMEFEQSDPKEQLRASILIYKENIIERIKSGDIDLLPFRSFKRAEFLELIASFNLDTSAFSRWQKFIDTYTILVWKDLSCYPLQNKDKQKLPTFVEMERDERSLVDPKELFISMPISIVNNIMDKVLVFAGLSDFKAIEKIFYENYQNIIPIMESLSYFADEIPLKVCVYLFCQTLKKRDLDPRKEMPYFLRNILISEEDLKDWEKFPKIKTELLEQFIPKFSETLKSIVWLRENKKEQAKILDLSNNCLSQLTETEGAEVVLLSHNNLNSIRLLPQNMNKVMILDLSYNNFNFNDWDLNMPDLLFFNVAHNNITELEAGWARDLKDVILLDLSYNRLGNSIFVPGWTWGFEGYIDKDGVAKGGLKWLTLAYNDIRILHKGWARGLKRLKILDLSGNPLERIEKGWSQGLDGLQYIILPKNIKPGLKNQIDWELNTIPAFLFGRQPLEVPRVKIIER